ncbi:MAG: arylesterase, partial [Oligoflexia bacterium]
MPYLPRKPHLPLLACLALAQALSVTPSAADSTRPIVTGPTGTQSMTIRVVTLGDSLTEGHGVAQTQAYPSLLEAGLHQEGFKNVKIVNAGIGGSTSASALPRARWHLRAKPDLVLLALGANDMLRGIPAKDCEKNLAEAITLLQQNNVSVILAGMRVPPNYGADYRHQFESIVPRLAARFHVPLIPFLLEGVGG